MKKIIAFAVRKDELSAFKKYSKEFNFSVKLEEKSLTPETVELCKGYDGVTFLGNCNVNREVLEKLNSFKIKYIASRSTGYNNVDLKAAKELGIYVSNSTYSSYSVAEFAVMSAFILLRNIPQSLKRVEKYNFSLGGLIGRELRNQTIGIIGTGKIGRIVAHHFKAMGAKVIAYDLYPSSDEIEYVSLEELFAQSDIISLHTPLTPENHHLINKETIAKMKNDVLIINSARGELVNLEDLIAGLKSKKIAGVALDTLEKEVGILHKDCSNIGFEHPQLKELLNMENVMITSHQAFYTDQAVSDMVESALTCLNEYFLSGNSKNNLIK